MDFLFDNPLANLPGPEFLVFYTFFIIAVIIGFRVLRSRHDRTEHLAVPPIPNNPDPFEIAYLRAGANELARAIVFSLVQKNLLEILNEEKISRICPTNAAFERRGLQPIELTALEWFDANRQPKELFQKNGLAEKLKPFGETFQARLEMQHLLPAEETKRRNTRLAVQAFLIFGGIGAYKFAAALYNGYTNIGVLIFIFLTGIFALGLAAKMPRLTRLGKIYLERLQLAFDKIKPSNHYANLNSSPVPSATFAAVDPFLLSVGVFGGAALAGTIYSDYNQTFERAQNQSAANSGGCGAGCGSSSSSSGGGDGSGCGSGCGGGCGGCG